MTSAKGGSHMNGDILEIEHFSKTYKGGNKAVDDLNLCVAAGSIYGFIGPNGAGKTTTLSSIAGILDFEEGTIRIKGIDIKKDPVAAKKITAFLPDNPDLYEFLKGADYLNFIGDLYMIPDERRTQLIKKYADAFKISDVLGSPISGYSHGMKQKLALTSALMREPTLLMLDEPFVGLDPLASHILKEYLHELCDRGGAVFFSTHVLEVAQNLCDHIAIIKNGRLVESGTTAEVTGKSSLEDVFLELAGNPDDSEAATYDSDDSGTAAYASDDSSSRKV
jgi:ABC-2 type transport system ATP-binding protein